MIEVVRESGVGLWVGADQYSKVLPKEAEAKFIVQRTAKGLWRVAVKGYNEGDFFDAEVNSNGQMAARIDDQHYRAMDSTQRLMAIDDNTMQSYEAAVKGEEHKDRRLLLYVLESEKRGLWTVSGPAEYNDYEEFAQLLYSDSSQVGLAWGEQRGWNESRPEQSGYHLNKSVSAQVITDGPEYHVRPYDKRIRGIRASAIEDRVKYYPSAANLVRDLTEDDRITLVYMNDSFAYGCPRVEAPEVNPIEAIYGK